VTTEKPVLPANKSLFASFSSEKEVFDFEAEEFLK